MNPTRSTLLQGGFLPKSARTRSQGENEGERATRSRGGHCNIRLLAGRLITIPRELTGSGFGAAISITSIASRYSSRGVSWMFCGSVCLTCHKNENRALLLSLWPGCESAFTSGRETSVRARIERVSKVFNLFEVDDSFLNVFVR